MGVAVYGLMRSGTTLVADLLTLRGTSLVISEPDLFVDWHPRTVGRIDELIRTFGLPVGEAVPRREAYGRYQDYFDGELVPKLAGLELWGIKQVDFREWQGHFERYRPRRLVLCVRDLRDVALSAIDLICRQKLAFPGRRRLRDEAWILARLCHDVQELMAMRALPHHVVRYEDLVADPAAQRRLADFVGLRELGSERLNLQGEAPERSKWEISKHGGAISGKSVARHRAEPAGPARAMAERLWRLLPEYSEAFKYPTPPAEAVLREHPFSRTRRDGEDPVPWHRLNSWNWRGPETLEPTFARRAARILAARNIPPGSVVLDLDGDVPALRHLLPEGCRYVASRLADRGPRPSITSKAAGAPQGSRPVTLVTALGTAEYAQDLPEFLRQLRDYDLPVLLSYHATEDTAGVDRGALGWVNHLSREELLAAFAAAGFRASAAWAFDGRQSLFRLGLAP
jgi:hypothetical protein